MKKRLLFWIGLICGVTPLVVASILFINFWIARTFYATPISSKMENYNFYWLMVSLPLISLGLGILLYCYHKNRPLFIKKIFMAMLIILLNIPIGSKLLNKYLDMHWRAYIKISNVSNCDLIDVKIKGSNFSKDIGNLKNQSSTVVYYYPKYADELYYHPYPEIDTVRLLAKNNSQNLSIILPRIDKGECKALCISKTFELVEE